MYVESSLMEKNKGGRPLKFKSPEELQEKIDDYFAYCDNRIQQVYSPKTESVIEVINPAPYTMSGLAVALGVDRKTLLNYSNKEEFFLTIKKARNKVEADVEERMNDKQTFTPGLIFNAKNNFDWKDRTEQDITSKGERIQSPIMTLDEYSRNNSTKEDKKPN